MALNPPQLWGESIERPRSPVAAAFAARPTTPQCLWIDDADQCFSFPADQALHSGPCGSAMNADGRTCIDHPVVDGETCRHEANAVLLGMPASTLFLLMLVKGFFQEKS